MDLGGHYRGIDLALALIAQDLGRIGYQARRHNELVALPIDAPGAQSQFSGLLELDARSDRIAQALAYARKHLRTLCRWTI